ncbi:DUF1742-domain-containing protein [Dendrothele bispora CBS 962.96]|uniref:DUF1742-domain-containing protein n=1 Tax=Dendrothele bispora (strain CBS 962.96) TaxID=1314807 RepID=A0A4V4HI65_DENBC|nr:DUF1742-domain-containing protein [Dendrothele bispora CBS 962.96]
MSFTNLYYKRATGTAKPCYICFKPTTTVLATINTVDFLYTCDTHLSDRGFASPVGEDGDGAGGVKKIGLSAEEISKVKEEWEERQKKKAEKEKAKEEEKEKEKDNKEGESKEDKEVKSKNKEKSTALPGSLPSPGTATPPKPTHERYTLHRDFFAMRLAEHRKRRQAAEAKEIAPRFPGVPKGGVV